MDGRITASDAKLARRNLGASLQASVHNPQAYQVPANMSDQSSTVFKILGRNAGYRNEFGIFLVDDASGRMGNLKPSDPGYIAAAMSEYRRRLIFSGNQGPDSVASLNLKPGQYFGTFIVSNGTLNQWLSQPKTTRKKQPTNVYVSLAVANPDKFPHVLRVPKDNIALGYEDLWHGGDRDYNDISVEIKFVEPEPECGFDEDLSKDGWQKSQTGGGQGSVSVEDGKALLREGDSFTVELQKSFIIPSNQEKIVFEYGNLQFDTTTPGFINDAFEVALLGDNGQPLVPTFAPGRDAFFNVTEGLNISTGSSVTLTGSQVILDLAGQIPGTPARLVFRLVNNDSDTTSSVEIVCAKLPPSATTASVNSRTVADSLSSPTDILLPQKSSNGSGQALSTLSSGANPPGTFAPQSTILSGDSFLDSLGRAIFTTSDDFLAGRLFNVIAEQASGDLKLDLNSKKPTGSWSEILDSGRSGTFWGGIELDKESIPGTLVEIRVRASDDRSFLEKLPWISVSEGYLTAQVSGQFLELETKLKSVSENLSADIVIAVDESGSMAGEQAWIGPTVKKLEERLSEIGYTGNRYALVGFADTPRSLPNSNSRFLSSTEFVTATSSLTTSRSSNEDGYRGLDYVIQNFEYRSNATNIVVLITDEDRTTTNSLITKSTVTNQVSNSNVIIHSILNAIMTDGKGREGMGVDSTGVTFVKDDFGGYTESSGGFYVNSETVGLGSITNIKRDYVDLTWELGGTVWDLNKLRDGGTIADSFSQAFIDRLPLEVGNTPVVREILVQTIPLPTVEVELPKEIAAGTSLVISGLATAAQPVLPSGAVVRNSLTHVTLNGKPVDLLDSSGQFFMKIEVQPGINRLEFAAYDIYGQVGRTIVEIGGVQKNPGDINFSNLSDISASFTVEYARTSFFEHDRSLLADVTIRNTGQYPVDAPLFVAISNLSDPLVMPRGAKGYTPEGLPYYDVSDLVPGGKLASGQQTSTLEFAFFNPNEIRFSYDLKFFGLLNRPPVITTIPVVEAFPGRSYQYDVHAVDPDNDPVRFSLITAPASMTIDPTTGLITWTPADSELGSHPLVVRASDGRGGFNDQRFTIEVDLAPPNRPPVFTSLPVNVSYIGKDYKCDADAVDPDSDTLTFSLLANPSGMTIDPATGLISWKPTAEQKGETTVTVQADDTRGGKATQIFTLCAVPDPDNHAPVIVSQPVVLANPVKLVNSEIIRYEGSWMYKVVNFDGLQGFESPGFNDSDFSEGLGGFGSNGGCLLNQTARKTDWPLNTDILLRKKIVLPSGAKNLIVRGAIDNDIQIYVNGVEISKGMQTSEGCAERNEFQVVSPESLIVAGENTIAIRARDRGSVSYVDVALSAELPDEWTIGMDPFLAGNYVYHVVGIDPDEDVLSFSLMESPAGMSIDGKSGVISWSPDESTLGKTFPVVVRVTDGRGGMDEQRFEAQVVADASPPPPLEISDKIVIKSTAPADVNTGSLYRYDISVIGPEKDVFDFGLITAPEGMSVHPSLGVVVWNPTSDQIGTHQVVLRVRDQFGGYAQQAFTVNVAAANTAPVITSAPKPAATVGLPYQYQARAQDAEGQPITYALGSDTPANVSIDPATGLVRFVPAADQVGLRSFRVIARDSQGAEAQQNVSLNVVATSVNQPPVVSGNHRKVAWLGRDYVSLISADDPNGDPLAYEVVDGPAGMTIDDQAVVNWSPTGNVGDLVDVTLRVSDGRGGEVIEDFVIELLSQEQNNRPVVTSVPTVAGTVMQPYRYDPAAFDAEGDPVEWLLDKAPRGMSINPATGQIAWTPEGSHLGPQQVVLRVRDAYFAESTQSFTVMVTCNNQAPQIASRPVTETWEGSAYIYFVRADDPENDPLKFSLLASPQGMTIDATTGLIRWSPAAGTAGSTARVVIAVGDGQGNQATQSFDLKVGQNQAALKNRAPVITSRPRLAGTAGQSYSYKILARDPEGDALSYSLTTSPDRMAVDAATGLLTWTPSETAIGSHVVTVSVSDALGGKATQSYILSITANQAPKISSTAITKVVATGTYAYDIQAQEPNGDALSYRLENQPSAMSIDTNGRISWPTTLADIGRFVSGVRVIVSDPAGLSDSQTFNITVETDTEAPRVSLKVSSTRVNLGSQIQVQVTATDNLKVNTLTLIARQGGKDVFLPLGPTGLATFDTTTAGMVGFVATATDFGGNQSSASSSVRVIDPSDTAGPDTKLGKLVQILPGGQKREFDPNTETPSINYLLDITGTIDDPDNKLDSWKVIVATFDKVDPANIDTQDPIWRTIGSGTTEVTDAKLATLDPTVMANGSYTVAIVSTDTNGQQTIKTFDVNVEGQAKLGQFRQEFTDLTIPLNGVPITITRTYDTQDIGREGDFGYGWSLGMMSANIQELVPPAPTDGFFNVAAPFTTKTRVFINAPDGRRLSFKFQPRFAGGFLFFSYHVPEFVAEAGNTDYRLEVDTSGINPNAKGEWLTMLLPFAYNPDNYRLIAKDGTTYHYNQTDGLQRITDPNGNTVDFGPNSIVHSGGQRITMDRDYRSRITKITDPSGASINYTYDANGDLIKVTDQAGLPTTITYEPTVAHYVKSITDSNGKTAARMEYDASGRLTGVIDANGNRVTQSFDPGNFTQTITDGNGKPTIVSYDERGNLLRSEIPTSSGTVVKIYEYKDPANPDKETRIVENGIERTFSYDAQGNKLKETTPAGTTSWTYTTLGKIGSETDPLGRITSYSHDAKGNVTETVNPLGQKSTYVYDTLGRVADFTDFNGQKTVFTDYCGCGRPKTIVNPDGTSRKVDTNQFAQVTKVVDEKGNLTENIYDNVGRLIQVIDGEGRTLKYEYSGANVTKVTDGLNNVTTYTYFENNKRKSITDAEGGVTDFTYDKNGNQKTIKDPVGNITEFFYDEANRLIKETDPLGKVKTFKYDTRGNRIETIDRLARNRTFEYDAMNRLTTETWWDGGVAVTTITMTYDAVGNRLTANSPDARLTYIYDTANRIKTARTEYPGTALQPVTLTYTYDAMGNVTEIRDNLGVSVISTYDFRNNLTSRAMSGTGVGDGVAVKMEYDTNGERHNILRFDDAARTRTAGRTDFTYFKNGLIQSINHTSATGALISAYGYQYDELNRLKQETHHGDTYAYGYDRTSQLISVIKNGKLTESFDFDANGNREKATGLTPGNYVNEKGNRYSSDGTFKYTYDAEGNLKTKTRLSDGQVTEYFWDYRNRLSKVEERSAGGILLKTVEYKYDALDRRIAVIINGTTTLLTTYDRDHAWADFSATGAVEKRYLISEKIDEIIAAWVAGQDFTWYHSDKLGTIRDLSNMAGVIGQPIVYSAFGQIQSGLSGKEWNRFTFTGREWQPETGLYYYRARYYDATSGRFISEDPIGFEAGDKNLNRYVKNMPTFATDPSGKVSIEYVTMQLIRIEQTILSIIQMGGKISILFCVVAKILSFEGNEKAIDQITPIGASVPLKDLMKVFYGYCKAIYGARI
jgi:RHS repeat-associated protein